MRRMQFIFVLLLAFILASGCTTFVKTDPDGTKWEYYSFMKDNSVDEISVDAKTGTASLKGGKSGVNAAVTDLAATTRKLAGAGASAAGVP